MGTSKTYAGARTGLVPSWVDEPAEGAAPEAVPVPPSMLPVVATVAMPVSILPAVAAPPSRMARFNELLRNLDIPAVLRNPYRHNTKGEMVAECADVDFLRRIARHTMSCSGPTKNRFARDEAMRKWQHCGYCVPCLIRRAALVKGLGEDDTPYGLGDLRARVLDTNAAEGQHVRSFQVALARLSAKPERARFDIHRPGPLIDHPGDLAAYERVYVEGLREVGAFLSGVEARPR